MTVFYRGRCAHITHEVFEARRPHHRRFMIRDIRHPYLARRPSVPAVCDRAQLRGRSAGVAGAAAVAAAIGGPALSAASMPLVATAGLASILGLVVASSLVFAACVRIRDIQVHELWAIYQGQTTCLFDSTDERTFGQVTRALRRAIEQCGRAGADADT